MLKVNLNINDLKFSFLYNKNYLIKLKEYNGKINLENIEIHIDKIYKEKHRSPNPRNNIYNRIKHSLQKLEDELYKNSVGQSENFFRQKNIECNIIDINSEKTFKKDKSPNAIQMIEKNEIN